MKDAHSKRFLEAPCFLVLWPFFHGVYHSQKTSKACLALNHCYCHTVKGDAEDFRCHGQYEVGCAVHIILLQQPIHYR